MLQEVHRISDFVVPFNELESEMFLKIAAVNISNKKCPIYQYLHTNLEVQYNLLILYYFCEKQSILDAHITNTAENLITISRTHFKRSCNEVFLCHCLKHFFGALQYVKQKTDLNGCSFWNMFNSLLKNDEPLFSLCLLKELVKTEDQLIKENLLLNVSLNFEFLEAKLKECLNSAESSTMPEVLKMVDIIVNEIWSKKPKIEVFQIIWDYYSKRLNVSSKNYSKNTSLDFLKTVENVLSKENCKEDFEIFVAILIVYLKQHPELWSKMKGRIYSQLGTNKLKELSETGIAHVSMLFMALSSLFYEEMQKRTLSLFDVLAKEKKELPITWNVYMAFVSMLCIMSLLMPILFLLSSNAVLVFKFYRLFFK